MFEFLIPVSFFGMITAIAVGRPLVKAYARRIDAGIALKREQAPELAERMERLETTVETLTVALERSLDEQRFLTRLLSDRAAPGDARIGDGRRETAGVS